MRSRSAGVLAAAAIACAVAGCDPISVPLPPSQDADVEDLATDTTDPGAEPGWDLATDPATDTKPDVADPGVDVTVCPAERPFFVEGACVECRDAKDCPQPGDCDMSAHVCVGTVCGGMQKLCADQQCHECCVNEDCFPYNKAKCQPGDFTCYGILDLCLNHTCAGVSPWCFAQPPDGYACVQCLENAHCPQGEYCNPSSHSCMPGVPCATDSDCPASACRCQNNACVLTDNSKCVQACPAACNGACATTTPTLALTCLDGFCIDKNGGCDPDLACCGIGQQCVPLKGQFGYVPPAIPVPTTPLAVCTCGEDKDCINNRPCQPTSILCDLVPTACPGGVPPKAWPKSVCYDLKSLPKPI